jgi:hypothetical protein
MIKAKEYVCETYTFKQFVAVILENKGLKSTGHILQMSFLKELRTHPFSFPAPKPTLPG